MTKTLSIVALVIGAWALAPSLLSAGTGAAAADTSPKREAAVDWAVAQVGTTERGTSNCSPKIDRWQRDMGLRVPPCRVWCGAFVHQAFLRAGVKLSARLIDPDRSYADAVAGRRGLKSIPMSQIRRGDIVFYDFRPDLRASHLAIARGRPRGGSLDTVEGNTSNAVRLERRGLQYAVLAARVVGAG
jgi:cell wall-associated NlpC family hydrolase